MQTDPVQLKRQQEILKVLGYYTGKCDGVWGPASIQAKKQFEACRNFLPGRPTFGMPFDNSPLPKGIYIKDGLLYHPLLENLIVETTEPKTK
jgi:hypothetical protein